MTETPRLDHAINLCEWDPTLNTAADLDSAHLAPATVCVGAGGEWHLCDACAALPRFARFTTRVALRRQEALHE